MITVNIYQDKKLIGTIIADSDDLDNLIQAVNQKFGKDHWNNFEVIKT